MDEFMEQFNEVSPPIVIPDEVVDDVDADYDFEWSPGKADAEDEAN
jgi:hypothetical protein